MKKIAVPVTSENKVDDHFGHCEYYKVYTLTDNNEIIENERIKSDQGCGCKSNIASVLAEKGVEMMLAGGIGAGAINVLNNWGIEVVRGCSGDAAELVQQFAKGGINDSGESCRTHEHHHENGHNCAHN